MSPRLPSRPSRRLPRVDAELRRPLLLVAGLVLLLCCGGLGVTGFFRLRSEPADAARIAADAFAARLVAGDYAGAYDQLCVASRERLGRAEFVAAVGGRPAVRSYRLDRVERAGDGYAVEVTLTDPSGATEEQVLRVVEDRGSWRVCGNPLPPAG